LQVRWKCFSKQFATDRTLSLELHWACTSARA